MENIRTAQLNTPASDDYEAARSWVRRVRGACEDLFGDPSNTQARAAMVDLLVRQAPEAVASLNRATRPRTAPPGKTV
ncbi:Uncharacterised protein [Mycobacteroides abscessus subsp. massiliense]|nr:Uncharacterised protein [Mycobacteroides abscessus subsp. massiliense]